MATAGNTGLIDILTLALTHGLMALALWRLLFRADLDADEGEARRRARPWRKRAGGAGGPGRCLTSRSLGFIGLFLALGLKRPFFWVLAYIYIDVVAPQKIGWGLIQSLPVSLIAFAAAFAGWLFLDTQARHALHAAPGADPRAARLLRG